jgi:hypothetical protein
MRRAPPEGEHAVLSHVRRAGDAPKKAQNRDAAAAAHRGIEEEAQQGSNIKTVHGSESLLNSISA